MQYIYINSLFYVCVYYIVLCCKCAFLLIKRVWFTNNNFILKYMVFAYQRHICNSQMNVCCTTIEKSNRRRILSAFFMMYVWY